MTFRAMVVVIAVSIVSLQCAAQARKVSSEDLMDTVFDMKKASAAADKLASDGSKYCNWGISLVDTSDLDVAISRSLLNHGSQVPENISASKMWPVGAVAYDIIHKFQMYALRCEERSRYSAEARSVAEAAQALLLKLMMATDKFNRLAYRQTIWQEQNNQQSRNSEQSDRQGAGKVATEDILTAAREMRDTAEAASRLRTTAQTAAKGCAHGDSLDKPPDLADLNKLIDYMTRVSHSTSTVPAANMWGVVPEALAAQLNIFYTAAECSWYAAEKKNARNLAKESLQVYDRLNSAIATFYALAWSQTAWEEQTAAQQQVLREQ